MKILHLTCFSHYIRQVLEALKYCHSKRIVHGDIRTQCLLLANKENSTSIKLGGFGNAFEASEHGASGEGMQAQVRVLVQKAYVLKL
jgi:serine/threonine protein kinase